MHLSLKHLALAALAGGAVTFASCGEDEDLPPVDPRDTNRAPTLTIENPSMSMVNGIVEVGDSLRGGLFEFTLDGDDPDGNLRTLQVFRNGSAVGAGSNNVQVEFDGTVAPLSSASVLLFGDDKRDFSKTVRVRASQDFADTLTYMFVVTDTFDLKDTAMVTLATGVAPTPLASTFNGAVFFSRSAPRDFFGALDLDTGEAVASSSTEGSSELQDQGNSGGSWLRQLVPENGAELRVLTDGTSADFANVNSVESLLRIYDRAASSDDGGNVTITPPISTDASNPSILVVKRTDDTRGDIFYLVRIYATDGTAADNRGDFYTADIKRTQ